MSPTEIWIARGGSACGPYTKQQVDRLVKDGLVYQDDLAWSPGAQSWVELDALSPKKTPRTRAKAAPIYKLHKKAPADPPAPDAIPAPSPNRRQSRSPGSSSELGNRAADLVQLRAARRERLMEAYACSLPVSKRWVMDATDEQVAGLIWKTPAILALVSAAFGLKGLFTSVLSEGVKF